MSRRKPGLRIFLWLMVLGTAALIFAFSAESGELSSATSDAVTQFFIRIFDTLYDTRPAAEQTDEFRFASLIVRKCAHFSEFALLGLWLRWLFAAYTERHRSLAAWGIGTAYAVTDEVHQLFVSQRAAMPMDVLIDSLGVMAGVLVAWAAWTLAKRRRGGSAG